MHLRYLGLILVASAAFAQTGTPLIPGVPISCFTRNEGSINTSFVDTGMPDYPRALRIGTQPGAGPNPWSARARCFNTNAVTKGDHVVATFWMHTTAAVSSTGFATFVLERNDSPYTKSIETTVQAGLPWKKFEIPFTIVETYAANAYNFSFWVTFDPQDVEIAGLSIVNYGSTPFSQLGLANWPYEGHAADAPWRSIAASRIDKYRKTFISAVARDASGNPLAGVPVHVRMKRHTFGFGTAVAGDELQKNEKYRSVLLQNFNKVVPENDLKWPFWETWARPAADFELPWYAANGFTMVRGHNVIWPNKSNLPADVQAMLDSKNTSALRARINSHTLDVMSYAKGKVTEWDVLNEPYTSKDVQALLGDAEMAEWFKLARQADPTVKLYINDYNITEVGGTDVRHQDFYFNTIQGILANGGPVDGIGLQSHFDSNLTGPERVWEILDRFASFGKELQITEFDVNVSDEQLQADYMRDYLTATFAHPSVTGFMNWGFWASRHWLPAAALFRADWSIKPNGQVWRDLVYRDWWTDVTGVTGTDGVFRTRGFAGDYDIEVGASTLSVNAKVGTPAYATTGKAAAISIDRVTNAAGYTDGGIAPGEMITLFVQQAGSQELRLATGDEDRKLPNFVGDTRVLFDGVAAPMIYSLRGQISAIVPYGVSGSTKVQLEYLGSLSDPVTLTVRAAVPGLFTRDFSGKGQIVASNGTTTQLNTSQTPVSRGEFLSVFVTGEGAVNPSAKDGYAPPVPYPRTTAPVRVVIGGVDANPADTWSGLVYAGVTQVNARVPANAPIGSAVPIAIYFGDTPTQTGATIAVK